MKKLNVTQLKDCIRTFKTVFRYSGEVLRMKYQDRHREYSYIIEYVEGDKKGNDSICVSLITEDLATTTHYNLKDLKLIVSIVNTFYETGKIEQNY